MKKLFLTLATALGLGAASAGPTPSAPITGSLTNIPTYIASNGASNINAQVRVWRDRGMTFLPLFAGTNAGTATQALTFQVSDDAVYWSPAIATYQPAMNGSTAVKGYYLISRDVLENVKWVRLATWTNSHTASIFPTNVIWSVFP